MKSLLIPVLVLLWCLEAQCDVKICKSEFFYTHGDKPYKTYENVKIEVRQDETAAEDEGKKPQPVYFTTRNTYATSATDRYRQMVVSELVEFCRNSTAVNTNLDALKRLNGAVDVNIFNATTPVMDLPDFQEYIKTLQQQDTALTGGFFNRNSAGKDFRKKSLLTVEYKMFAGQQKYQYFLVHSDYLLVMALLNDVISQAADWDAQVLKNNLTAAEMGSYQNAVNVGQEVAEENEAFFREQLANIDQKAPDMKEMNGRILGLIRKLSQKGYDKSKETVFDKFKKFNNLLMNQNVVQEASRKELLNCAEIPWTTTEEYPTLFVPATYSDLMQKSIRSSSDSAMKRCRMVLSDLGVAGSRAEDAEEFIKKIVDKTTTANFPDLQYSEYQMMKQTRLGRMLLISLMISKGERGFGNLAEGTLKCFCGVGMVFYGATLCASGPSAFIGARAIVCGCGIFACGIRVLMHVYEEDTWWSLPEILSL